jgi:UDP-glucose 4-epimerase
MNVGTGLGGPLPEMIKVVRNASYDTDFLVDVMERRAGKRNFLRADVT